MFKSLAVPCTFATMLAIAIASAKQIPLGAELVHHANTGNQAITPELSFYLQGLLDVSDVPGLSVGVVRLSGKGEVETEYGSWGNMTEDGDKVTHETLFNIGSCSKAFLSAAVGILIDDFAQGKNVTALPPKLRTFTWDTKIKHLLPEWNLVDEWATEKANVKDILSHVSGLPRHDVSYAPGDTISDMIHKMQHLKPVCELRERWYYNNQMYVLGSYIIATYSGMSFTSFVQKRIFEPLNMTSTVYSDQAAKLPNFSQTFTSNRRRIPFWFSDPSVADFVAGAGGVVSNSVDMSKWLSLLINEGIDPVSNETIIPASAFVEATSAHSIIFGSAPTSDSSFLGYGLGWIRLSYKGHEMITHNGGLPGFLTFTAFFPYDGFGVVAMVNSDAGYEVLQAAGYSLVHNVLGFEPPTSQNWASSLSPMYHSMPVREDSTQSYPEPELPLEAYEGTYSDPGYGAFTLCSPMSTSNYCWGVLTTFATVLTHNDTPGLYAAWPRVWTSHLQIIPVEGNRFDLQAFTIFPEGYGKDKAPFVARIDGGYRYSGEFIVKGGKVQGLAFPDGLDAEPLPNADRDRPLEETAIVYFERV